MTRRLVPLALLAVACVYLWAATQVPLDPWSEDGIADARTLPFACGTLLTLLALGMAIRGVPVEAGGGRLLPLGGMLACVLAFIVVLPFAGLWPSLALFLIAALAALGERRPAVLLGASLGTALLGWALVEILLGVYLHPGSWWA